MTLDMTNYMYSENKQRRLYKAHCFINVSYCIGALCMM